jgi:histone-lysine N-methyltransferase SETMAR
MILSLMPRGQNISSGLYTKTLKSLHKYLRSVGPHKNAVEILLQLNARPHTSMKTEEEITKPGKILLLHPPYTTDLAPSGFHPFGALKDAIRGKIFGSDDEVMKSLRSVYEYKIQSATRRGYKYMLLFLAGARLLKLTEIM